LGAYSHLPFAKRLPTGTVAVLVFVRGKGSIRVLSLDRNDRQVVSSCVEGVVRSRRDAWLAPGHTTLGAKSAPRRQIPDHYW
jgi:hypothetical protein